MSAMQSAPKRKPAQAKTAAAKPAVKKFDAKAPQRNEVLVALTSLNEELQALAVQSRQTLDSLRALRTK